jgi:flagellin-specific chaperone FliS
MEDDMPVGLQAKQQYIEDQLAGLSPVQLLIKGYDVAIASCARKDQERLSRALVQLIGALNFEHHEMALGAFRLYNYCLRQAKMGRFDAAKPILVGLRDAWVEAERKMREEGADQSVGAEGRAVR